MRWLKSAAALMLCLGLVAARDAGTKVDNPEFKSWADHGIGTTVTVETIVNVAGQEIKSEETGKLTKKTDSECTLEMTFKLTLPGTGGTQNKTESRTVPSKVEQGTEYLPDNFDGSYIVLGNEAVTINGRKYACKIVQIEGTSEGVKAKGKCWVSDQVPGLMVKAEIVGEMNGQKLDTKSILKSVAIK